MSATDRVLGQLDPRAGEPRLPRRLPGFLMRPFYLLQRSGDLPVALILLGVVSLVRPYMGLVHDAKLYSLQVVNRVEGGWYADDLFFKYGSQDSYSVFSPLMAPLVRLLGLSTAFLLAYLVCQLLLVWSEVRLVRRLIPHPAGAIGGLLLLVLMELPYAGRHIFTVHECFLTARLPAQALVVLGLERYLADRRGVAGLLMLAALPIHPLMAIGGLAVWGLCEIIRRMAWQTSVQLAMVASLPVCFLIAVPGLAGRLFGVMDPAWFQTAREISPHCFPSDWYLGDWWRWVGAVVILGCASRYAPPRAERLLVAVMVLSALAVGAAAWGEWGRLALLVKGQPYRALWLLELLTVPCGVLLALRWRTSPTATAQLASLGAAAFVSRAFLDASMIVVDWRLTGIIFLTQWVLWASWFRQRYQSSAAQREWLWNSGFLAMVGTSLLLTFQNGALVLAAFRHLPQDPLSLLWIIPRNASGLALATLGVVFLGAVGQVARRGPRLAVAAAAVWLLGSSLVTVVANHPWYRERHQLGYADLAFIRREVHRESGHHHPPRLYYQTDASLIWLDIPAAIYAHWTQVQGAVFHPRTSHEARRRAELVKKFEVAWMRRLWNAEAVWERQLTFLHADLTLPAPSPEDLLKLAAEPELDWVILPDRFEGLFTATNGNVYLYDCRRLRAAGRIDPTGLAASAQPAGHAMASATRAVDGEQGAREVTPARHPLGELGQAATSPRGASLKADHIWRK